MAFFPNKPDNLFTGLDWHPTLQFGVPLAPFVPYPGSAMHEGIGKLGNPVTNPMENPTVLADGQPVLSRGHAARGIAHYNLIPISAFPLIPSVYIPLLYGLSSHQCSFACYSVTAPMGPVAVSTCVFPLLSCQTFGLAPTTLVFNNGSVQIGVSAGDVLASLFQSAIEVGVAAAASYICGKPFPKKPGPNEPLLDMIARQAGGETAMPWMANNHMMNEPLGSSPFPEAGYDFIEKMDPFNFPTPMTDADAMQLAGDMGIPIPQTGTEVLDSAAADLAAWVDGYSTDLSN